MKALLGNRKNFYKANLHCHSKYSDGRLSVEELKEEYKKRGYSIIAFTDHEHLIDNSHLNDDEFLAITSCEIAIKEDANLSTLKKFDMRVCHLNFYALDPHNTVTPCYSVLYDKKYITDEIRDLIRYDTDYERNYSVSDINKMIQIANENGFLVTYNHPSWSLENATHYLGYENLFAVEIYNTGCVKTGIIDDEFAFDDLLRAGKKIYCTACDDNHNSHDLSSPENDSFGGWVCINADNLEYNEIMNALKNGDFYASTGPQITSLIYDNDTVRIETSPCSKISLVTDSRRAKSVFARENSSISSAEFTLHDNDKYFRIRVEDSAGKKAYTQAYYKNEL